MLQTNATLIAVTEADVPFDWDRPGSPGDAKWAGQVPAYYRERIVRGQSAGEGVDVATVYSLILDTAAYALVELDTDDVVTITLDSGATVRAKATQIASAALGGFELVSTTRLELEPIAAP